MVHVCANCGITIRWQPTVIKEREYCCTGCSLGGPCSCDYDDLPEGAFPITRSLARPERIQTPRRESE